jgi:hypothetical protein
MADRQDATQQRNLAERLYGGFDVMQLADGAKRYSLPHTLGGTVLARTTTARVLLPLTGLALALLLIYAPFGPMRVSFGSLFLLALTVLPLHAIVALAALITFAITGERAVTHITIRPDGLVWQDRHFFAASDIWSIGYGLSSNQGKADETFEPKIEIQVGTRTIVLADNVDPIAGKLFMRLFGEDTRRYWHGHN